MPAMFNPSLVLKASRMSQSTNILSTRHSRKENRTDSKQCDSLSFFAFNYNRKRHTTAPRFELRRVLAEMGRRVTWW